MKEKLRFLGLDVHAETIAVAVAEPEGEVRSLGTIPNRAESIRKLIKKLGSAAKLRACYEAGPTGYVVYWQLAELGVECEVVAPTLVVRFLVPVMLILAMIGLFRNNQWPAITVLLAPLLLEFLAGVIIGYAVQNDFTLNTSASVLAGALGIVGLFALNVPHFPGARALTWGVSAFLLVLSAAMLDSQFGKSIPHWILKIGDSSYSLYLVHALVILTVGHVLLRLPIGTPNEAMMAIVSLLGAIPVSVLLYQFVEKPINNAARTWH